MDKKGNGDMSQLIQQTMTIKELATAAGCDHKTVRKVIAEAFPNLTKNGKVTRLTKDQALDIMLKLPKRNDIVLNDSEKNSTVNMRLDRLESKFNQLIDLLITTQIAKKEEPKQITAKLEPKDEIRKIINSYTHHTGTQYRDNWNLLYQECYYRLGKNFRLLAQNRGVKPIDIIIEEGFDMDVLLVSRDLFQLGRA